jgi:hypothetical protein
MKAQMNCERRVGVSVLEKSFARFEGNFALRPSGRDRIVLQIVSVLGIHTMSTGLPILLDELRKSGRGNQVKEGPLTAEQEKLKQEFVANRGYWNPVWEQLLQHAPEYFDAYTRLSSVPWQHGTLGPKIRELIYIYRD